MVRDNINIIRDFFRLVKGSKLWITFLFLGSILAHLCSLLIPVFTSDIVYHVTKHHVQATYLSILFLGVTYVAYNLFWFLNYVSYSYNFKYSYRNLREKIVDKVLTYDQDFEDKLSKGVILNTVNTDVAHLSEMIDQICEIIVVFVKVIALIFIFLKTNIIIGLIVLLFEYLYLEAYDYCNVRSTKYLMGQYKYRDKLTDNLSQILNGLSEIKTFHIYDKMKHNFNVIANRWSNQYMKKRYYVNIRGSLIPFIIHFGKIILYLVLVTLVLNGTYEVDTLILLISYFETTMTNTQNLMTYSRQIREWSVSIKRIETVLNYSSNQMLEFGMNDNDYIQGLVQFDHVTFSYKTKNKGNISDISFCAKPNQITALVGHSGSGKTTITSLLLRKYKVDSGQISIDGENIYDYSKKIYSTNVVSVNQSPFIFDMSIRKNLSLIDANPMHQIEACKRVGIHDYIMSLPKGYNTLLLDNASNFSGGQRQLLAIARTLLSKAEILIFDEVTSSLDPLLVEKIKEIFEDLKQDHTIIIITHKKDVMQKADHIVVLNKGKIVGEGTHDELMKENAYYIDLQTHNYSSSHKKEDSDSDIIKEG